MNAREDILIVRNDRLGDTILSLPVVSLLKDKFPGKRIHFWTSKFISPLLENVESIDSVISEKNCDLSSISNQLVNLPIKTAFCLNPTLDNALTLFKSRIPERVGTSRRWYSLLFNRRYNLSRRKSPRHEADLNLEMLNAYGITGSADFPVFRTPLLDRSGKPVVVDDLSFYSSAEKVVVIHPGSGGSARNWPAAYFRQLADKIADSLNTKVVVTGGDHEVETCEYVAGKRHFNACGKTDLLELATLLRNVELLITNSTGPLHLAVALGTKAIGLYPPLSDCLPSRWGPYRHEEWALTPDLPLCGKCMKGEISDCACMEELSVDSVMSLTRKLIG